MLYKPTRICFSRLEAYRDDGMENRHDAPDEHRDPRKQEHHSHGYEDGKDRVVILCDDKYKHERETAMLNTRLKYTFRDNTV